MHTEIEKLLRDRLGFDIETIGPRAVDAVVQRSMEKAGVSDPAQYARLLARDPEAWNRLVDRVVIPETWFFRDQAPYELAAHRARAHIGAKTDRVLRVLSCPCSTGEEPYSLAMALLDAGAPAGSFHVDAVDVSRRSLETARSAIFRKRSFRNDASGNREAYFESTGADGHWRLKSSAASLVRFQHGNLIAPGFLNEEPPYDIVFCRNLLIYLHSEARLLAMAALRRLLAEEGLLVLGHAEATFAREHGFRPAGPAAAFALIKAGAKGVPSTQQPQRKSGQDAPARAFSQPPSASVNSPSSAPSAAARLKAVPARAVSASENMEVSKLALARQLGDAGDLETALAACREYLESTPDSAEGYFLLGVLHDALGDFELAARDFRKVLYLDPAHRDALLHLALKREAVGDSSGAALLRARAQRAQNLGTVE
jgi:chemotaxis protein methyltransferase WspC